MKDLSAEVFYRTARSGGKGGQNVNKVETMVQACWVPETSALFTDEEKALIRERLGRRISKSGVLTVRSSASRSQAENKAIALERMLQLVDESLVVEEERKATKPSRAVRQKRLDSKKQQGLKKQTRQRYRGGEE